MRRDISEQAQVTKINLFWRHFTNWPQCEEKKKKKQQVFKSLVCLYLGWLLVIILFLINKWKNKIVEFSNTCKYMQSQYNHPAVWGLNTTQKKNQHQEYVHVKNKQNKIQCCRISVWYHLCECRQWRGELNDVFVGTVNLHQRHLRSEVGN